MHVDLPIVTRQGITALDAPRLRELKRLGFADARIAELLGTDEASVRHLRHTLGVRPVYKRVDSCAAEFATSTAYMYRSEEHTSELQSLMRISYAVFCLTKKKQK